MNTGGFQQQLSPSPAPPTVTLGPWGLQSRGSHGDSMEHLCMLGTGPSARQVRGHSLLTPAHISPTGSRRHKTRPCPEP